MMTMNANRQLIAAHNAARAAMPTLTLEDAKHLAPAVFGRVARHMTDRYEHVRTNVVLEGLLERGYRITTAKQECARSRDPLTVRHMLTLVHEKALAKRDFPEGVPTLLVTNSHNGRSALKFSAGFYRFICANGLIVGVTEQEFSFRHAAKPLSELDAALAHLAERSLRALEYMDEWSAVALSERKQRAFARQAAVLRFGEAAAAGYPEDAMLRAPRAGDEGDNLWRVMNRVQENLMRGGIQGTASTGRKITSRPVNNITLDLEFNRGLWTLAEKFAEAA